MVRKDGRVAGRVRSRDYQIFWDRWVDLLSYGALLARASRTWSSAIIWFSPILILIMICFPLFNLLPHNYHAEKQTKIKIDWIDLTIQSWAATGTDSFTFRIPCSGGPNWGPKGRKKFFWRPPSPFLRVWLTAPPAFISRSGSGTALCQDGWKTTVVW